MCDAFSSMGIDVTLAIPQSASLMPNEEISENVRKRIGRSNSYSIITYPKFTFCGRLNSIGGYWSARKLLQDIVVDVCFVRSPQFLHLAIKQNIPTIFEAHNSLMHTRSKVLNKFWMRKLLSASKSDKLLLFIAISRALTNYWIQQGIDPKKSVPFHDGIDFLSFEHISDKGIARRDLALDLEGKIVVYAGSLYPDRGIEDILRLAKKFSDVKFIVLGGPEDQKEYYSKIKSEMKLTNLQLTGWLAKDKVKQYLSAADALLMIWTKKVPTINYCSPLKMFEYMATGRIIVGHAFPTIREVLTDGENACLAEPDSFEDLCNKLSDALYDPSLSQMAAKARDLVLKEYTWQKRAKTIMEKIGFEPVNNSM